MIVIAEKKELLEHLGLKGHLSVDAQAKVITQTNVSHAILETAEAENVSLIIMGARGMDRIQELLSGSVSSSVLWQTKANVLILHFHPLSNNTEAVSDSTPITLFSKVLVPTDFSRSAAMCPRL